jgi:hypothetical protein
MEPTPEVGEDASRPQLEGELRLVREAILLVATNASPRVLVAGLWFGERIADAGGRMADEAGVRLVPVRSAGSGRLGFSIERSLPLVARPLCGSKPRPAARPVLGIGR